MKDFNQKYFTGDSAAHSRSVYKGSGYDPQDLNRPHIGIANTFSENSAGHAHLRELAAAVKSAIWQAGGVPFEFGLPSTCAEVAIGTDTMCMDLAMRDIVASGIEIVSSVQHFDGLVLLSGCDNIVPGTLLYRRTHALRPSGRQTVPAVRCHRVLIWTDLKRNRKQGSHPKSGVQCLPVHGCLFLHGNSQHHADPGRGPGNDPSRCIHHPCRIHRQDHQL